MRGTARKWMGDRQQQPCSCTFPFSQEATPVPLALHQRSDFRTGKLREQTGVYVTKICRMLKPLGRSEATVEI